MPALHIAISSERGPYSVIIGSGVSLTLSDVLADAHLSRQRLVVSSPPIWKLHGRRLRGVMGPKDEPALIPNGERAKTLATVARLFDACVDRGLDRSGTVIAFGGGVVGDVAGFAAAAYLRGITLVQVPTTLLAQVDSAIGGKVGVNLPAGKNLVGAFHAPKVVACDPDVLRTLPRREFRSGLYEVVKYGVIASRPLFDRVTRNLDPIFACEASHLIPIVAECCQIKADVVTSDERESGPRRVLNFGHTVGHALEAVTEYRRFRHGEAIGYGMLAAAHLSAGRGLLGSDDQAALADLIRRMGPLPPVGDLRIDDALGAMAHDKKVINGRLHFVLANGIGATAIVTDVQTRDLKRVMRHLGMRA